MKKNLEILKGANIHILTEKDLEEYLPLLAHTKSAFEEGRYTFIGDQLRLYLASKYKHFLYIDSDIAIEEKFLTTLEKYWGNKCVFFTGYKDWLTTNFFYTCNLKETEDNVINKLYYYYSNLKKQEDYWISDGDFMEKFLSDSEKKYVLDHIIKQEDSFNLGNIGYGKMWYFYSNMSRLYKSGTCIPIYFTKRDIKITSELLNKYKDIWVLGRNYEDFCYQIIKDDCVIHIYNPSCDIINLFFLDMTYNFHKRGHTVKFIDISIET